MKFTFDIKKYIHNTSIQVALNTCTINGVGQGVLYFFQFKLYIQLNLPLQLFKNLLGIKKWGKLKFM